MSRAYFALKSEPGTYSFERLQREKKVSWDGIRNFTARLNLRKMKKGDWALFYHSGDDRAVVGIAEIVREAYQDPTTTEDFSAVDIKAVKALAEPVPLSALKEHDKLSSMELVRLGRVSVTNVSSAEFKAVLTLSGTKL